MLPAAKKRPRDGAQSKYILYSCHDRNTRAKLRRMPLELAVQRYQEWLDKMKNEIHRDNKVQIEMAVQQTLEWLARNQYAAQDEHKSKLKQLHVTVNATWPRRRARDAEP